MAAPVSTGAAEGRGSGNRVLDGVVLLAPTTLSHSPIGQLGCGCASTWLVSDGDSGLCYLRHCGRSWLGAMQAVLPARSALHAMGRRTPGLRGPPHAGPRSLTEVGSSPLGTWTTSDYATEHDAERSARVARREHSDPASPDCTDGCCPILADAPGWHSHRATSSVRSSNSRAAFRLRCERSTARHDAE